MLKIGILSGGGDAPGINAVIRAVVRRGINNYGYEFVGIKDGWRGLVDGTFVSLDLKAISGTLPRGGSILGTSRTNPFKHKYGSQKVLQNLEKQKLKAIVVIGGTNLMGGKGGIGLTFIGAVTIGYLEKILSINAVGEASRLMLTGVIIIGAVLFQRFRKT